MTPMIAWTYTHSIFDRPAWVEACTVMRGPVLLLERRSGRQEIRPGETIRMANGEVEHDVLGAKS